MKSHYNRNLLAASIRASGAQSGDVVFSHRKVGFFGVPEEGAIADRYSLPSYF